MMSRAAGSPSLHAYLSTRVAADPTIMYLGMTAQKTSDTQDTVHQKPLQILRCR